jgi:hypothetical protein
MLNRLESFYNEDTDTFNTGPNLKIAQYLGEDIDNPKITFHEINIVIEDRIKELTKRLQVFIKDFDKDQQNYLQSVSLCKIEIDNLENDCYVELKNCFIKCTDEIENQKSYNLLLQKQLTTLKKEKNDSGDSVISMNNKLDKLEKDLGIIVNAKRIKKK